MTSETHENHTYKFEDCRAKAKGTTNLVDCHSPKQALICHASLPFGNGYFCKHPERNKIISNTQNLEDAANSQSNILKSNE